jgi:hypothetical protein
MKYLLRIRSIPLYLKFKANLTLDGKTVSDGFHEYMENFNKQTEIINSQMKELANEESNSISVEL